MKDIVIAWCKDEEYNWKLISKSELRDTISYLIDSGVKPWQIVNTYLQNFYYTFPSYHEGKRNVWISEFVQEFYKEDAEKYSCQVNDHNLFKSIEDSDKFGYISPDGRYFHCGYGGHSSKARDIVGSLTRIENPVKYLEDNGWLAIIHNPVDPYHRYYACMAQGFRMTDDQISALERLQILDEIRDISKYI